MPTPSNEEREMGETYPAPEPAINPYETKGGVDPQQPDSYPVEKPLSMISLAARVKRLEEIVSFQK